MPIAGDAFDVFLAPIARDVALLSASISPARIRVHYVIPTMRAIAVSFCLIVSSTVQPTNGCHSQPCGWRRATKARGRIAYDRWFPSGALMRALFAVRHREPDTPDVKNKRNIRHYRGCLMLKRQIAQIIECRTAALIC